MSLDGNGNLQNAKNKCIVLTCDVEAFPDKALQDPVDTLIWGRFPGVHSSFGIDAMMDILDRRNYKMTFFLDVCERNMHGEKIDEAARRILDRGHDLQLHLHAESLPRDFWQKNGYKAPTWGMHQYDDIAARLTMEYARDTFVKMTGFNPIAYRGGALRYNQSTIGALKSSGIPYSFNYLPARAHGASYPFGPDAGILPVFQWDNGIVEVPLGCLRRPAKECSQVYDPVGDLHEGIPQDFLASMSRFWNLSREHRAFVVLLHSWFFLQKNQYGCYEFQNEEVLRQFDDLLGSFPDDVQVISATELARKIEQGEVELHTKVPLCMAGTQTASLQPLLIADHRDRFSLLDPVRNGGDSPVFKSVPADLPFPVRVTKKTVRFTHKMFKYLKFQYDCLLYERYRQKTEPDPARVFSAHKSLQAYKMNCCNICGAPSTSLYASYSDIPNRCGVCHAFERHRRFQWAYDLFIKQEYSFSGKKILVCTPGPAEMEYMFKEAQKLVSFDIRPVAWFDLQMDMTDMKQIEDSSFDCFVALAVLQHTREDEKAIGEIYRVLKPGGRFFTQASNIVNGRTRAFENVLKHYSEEEYKNYGVGTYRVYGDLDLIQLVGKRFAVKTFHGLDPVCGGTDFIVCGIKK